MKRVLIVPAVVLLMTSCRGATSDTEQQTTAAETARANGPVAIDWTDADLEKDASRIGYGSKPEAMRDTLP